MIECPSGPTIPYRKPPPRERRVSLILHRANVPAFGVQPERAFHERRQAIVEFNGRGLRAQRLGIEVIER